MDLRTRVTIPQRLWDATTRAADYESRWLATVATLDRLEAEAARAVHPSGAGSDPSAVGVLAALSELRSAVTS